MEQNDPTEQRALAHDLADLQRLIQYLQRRRAELTTAAGGAFDRRAVDATILLSKLWTAALNLRLQGIRLA